MRCPFLAMADSIFDPQAQAGNPDLKIIAAFERLSEGFRVLIWEKAKSLGISPIQIQILIFIQFHSDAVCKVSHLAQEFNLTKPTISEAVKALEQKGYVKRQTEKADARSHTLHLTDAGRALVAQTAQFANPMLGSLARISAAEKAVLLEQLMGIMEQLQRSGILSVQRMCFSCQHYQKRGGIHMCQFFNKALKSSDLRVDCVEYAGGG